MQVAKFLAEMFNIKSFKIILKGLPVNKGTKKQYNNKTWY